MKSLTAAAAVALMATGTASATSLSLEYIGSASGYRTLTIQEAPIVPISGNTPTNVLAGAFKLKDTTTNSAFGTFIAWCLDVSHWLGTGSGTTYAYESTVNPFSNSYGLSSAQQARVQGFFDANYYEGLETVRNQSAGFQIGLWEVLYDDDYSLTNNDTNVHDEFRGSIGNDGTRTRANNYLSAASSYLGSKKWNLTFLESKSQYTRQNLVTVSPVPLPAAGFLMIAGLAGLGAAARRRRKT